MSTPQPPRSLASRLVVLVAALLVLIVLEGFIGPWRDGALFGRHLEVLRVLASWEVIGTILAGYVGKEAVRTWGDRTSASVEDLSRNRRYEIRGSHENVADTIKRAIP